MGGISGSKSRSSSTQQQQSQQFVDPLTQQFRAQLFGAGSGLAASQLGPGGIGDVAGQLGAGLLGQGGQFLGGLQGTQQALGGQLGGAGAARGGIKGLFQAGFGADRAPGQLGQQALAGQTQGQATFGQGLLGRQALGRDPASQALQQQAFGQNPALGQQIGQLGTDISRQFSQGLLPQIQAQAIGSGQLGGGRQGVAQGLGIQSALDAFSRGATDLRGQDIGRQLQAAQSLGALTGGAAQSLGGLQQQGIGQQIQAGGALGQLEGQQFGQQIGALGAAGQLGLGQQGINQAGLLGQGQLGLGGLESLQGLFNLGLSPFGAEFQPLQNLAGLLGIGAPVVGQSSGSGTSSSKSGSFGLSIGG